MLDKEGELKLADTQKELIEKTVNETILKINSITMIDRMKILRNETFKNTEQLLYNYNTLKEHVADEKEYYEMINKQSSGSIVRYSKSKAIANEDEMMRCRHESYMRSKSDLERIEKALNKVKYKKGYKVIELRYLSKKENGDTYTFEEIAEILSRSEEYNETLSERTVRRWRSSLVQEIAIHIFGSDAI